MNALAPMIAALEHGIRQICADVCVCSDRGGGGVANTWMSALAPSSGQTRHSMDIVPIRSYFTRALILRCQSPLDRAPGGEDAIRSAAALATWAKRMQRASVQGDVPVRKDTIEAVYGGLFVTVRAASRPGCEPDGDTPLDNLRFDATTSASSPNRAYV